MFEVVERVLADLIVRTVCLVLKILILSPVRVELLLTTSSLLLTVLKDAVLYRHSNIHMYQVPDTPTGHTPATPIGEAVYWTSSDEVRGVLREQVELLVSVCSREASEQASVCVCVCVCLQ